ncbi:hypothetical protein [Curtobacterium sp. 260]|uniref:hypothetical protein n=1 Tax=Curtobacterium sp. 260 TaxID=2817748 RepID=UPI0027874847|nr:hypothetical protein [Curtobacterium sp. 260]MDP9737040.1 hypothetical protein [Curtobacterium sp. 260]
MGEIRRDEAAAGTTTRDGSRTQRTALLGSTTALVLLVLTGCVSTAPRGSEVDAATAKRSIVDLVERSTSAVGGDWTVYRGPAVEPCGQDVGDRVRYVYIAERAGSTTGRQRDVEAVRAVWEDAGTDVVDTGTGGAGTRVGIRGTSGPVTSIGLDAGPDRYRMSGVSVCAPGNASELRDDEFGDER